MGNLGSALQVLRAERKQAQLRVEKLANLQGSTTCPSVNSCVEESTSTR
jgi:hypothetical protein